ncbi:MAG: hypothetical protein E7655_05750 [Ruminococcaceae bacterium]|nr:hypothetical protein [Oscillospiraceae bacterium]
MMIKGNARKIIRLKNTESELFDEALFFLRDSADRNGRISEQDMLREADRIVSRNLITESAFRVSGRDGHGRTLFAFLAGAGSAGALGSLLLLLIR